MITMVMWDAFRDDAPWFRSNRIEYEDHPNYELVDRFKSRIEFCKPVYLVRLEDAEFAELIFGEKYDLLLLRRKPDIAPDHIRRMSGPGINAYLLW